MERGEDAEAVHGDDVAPAPASVRGADEVKRRGEAQEHQLEKLIRDGVNLVPRRGSRPSILAAAVGYHWQNADVVRPTIAAKLRQPEAQPDRLAAGKAWRLCCVLAVW